MESFNQMKTLMESVQADVDKFDAGNKSAGTRVRKTMQEVKKLCKTVRDDVQAAKTAK